MSKNSCPALLYYMTEGWRLLRWGLGVVPAITYHCNVVPVDQGITLSVPVYLSVCPVVTLFIGSHTKLCYACRSCFSFLSKIFIWSIFKVRMPDRQTDRQVDEQTDARRHFIICSPVRTLGGGGVVKSRMCPPYPKRVVKWRLNGPVSRNNHVKRVAPCWCLDGHVKEPYEMSLPLGARP